MPARVLNLVVVVDGEFRGEVENRLERVGRYHPSRLVLCSVHPRRTTIDAWCNVAAEKTEGPFSLGHEHVELEIGERHLKSTIVDPLVVPDLATLVWAPHGHSGGSRLAEPADAGRARRLPGRARRRRGAGARRGPAGARLRRRPRLAALDAVARARGRRLRPAAAAPRLADITAVTVRHRADSVARCRAVLRLAVLAPGLAPGHACRKGGKRRSGHAPGAAGEISVQLDEIKPKALPASPAGRSSGLERLAGPPAARRARSVTPRPDGTEQVWTVLGASAARGGILGEGVRQALPARPDQQARALRRARDGRGLPSRMRQITVVEDPGAAGRRAAHRRRRAGRPDRPSPARVDAARDQARDRRLAGRGLERRDCLVLRRACRSRPTTRTRTSRWGRAALLRAHAAPRASCASKGASSATGRRRRLRGAAAKSTSAPTRASTSSCSADGPDAHVASLFPGKPELDETARLVVGVPIAGPPRTAVPRVTPRAPRAQPRPRGRLPPSPAPAGAGGGARVRRPARPRGAGQRACARRRARRSSSATKPRAAL